MNLIIRETSPADWPEMAAIYKTGMETGLATFAADVPAYADWDASHLPVCRLTAVADGGIVGWAALSPVSERPCYAGVAEVSLYIAPAFWRRGIGGALLQRLCKVSEKAGFWTLESLIMSDNAASLKLHEKCGFRLLGVGEKRGKDQSGRWRDVVFMERRNGIG
ncbi:phosphinothricin N-acetyltransferase [Clostridia bacterium]|nr:phosphinothricin N-acetyltransferase [Clostridia bacterium]